MLNPIIYPKSIGQLSARVGLLTLVLAGANAAIYRRDSNGQLETPSFDGYEVIAYRENSFGVYSISGKVIIADKQLRYPSNEEFGKFGYACRTLRQSMKRFMELEYGGITAERYLCVR